MVDLDIINGTIAEWEAKELTFVVVERLAWLYIVRDNALMKVKEEGEEPVVMPTVAISSGSEFMEACSKANPSKLWSVLDETMETLKLVQPRLYDAVLRNIREL